MMSHIQQKSIARPIVHITARELWVFIGIMIDAACFEHKGENMFDVESEGIIQPPNMACYMNASRFKEIRIFITAAFVDPTKEHSDPWYQIISLIDDFNDNRKKVVAASIVKILDELMSAYYPQKSKTGNLPHLSYVLRKLRPLGSEFKCVSCGATGMMLHLELQRGKIGMQNSMYQKSLGATTACTVRMASAVSGCGQHNPGHDIFLGDSWFASVKTHTSLEEKFGAKFIGIIKTAHKNYPKYSLRIL